MLVTNPEASTEAAIIVDTCFGLNLTPKSAGIARNKANNPEVLTPKANDPNITVYLKNSKYCRITQIILVTKRQPIKNVSFFVAE